MAQIRWLGTNRIQKSVWERVERYLVRECRQRLSIEKYPSTQGLLKPNVGDWRVRIYWLRPRYRLTLPQFILYAKAGRRGWPTQAPKLPDHRLTTPLSG